MDRRKPSVDRLSFEVKSKIFKKLNGVGDIWRDFIVQAKLDSQTADEIIASAHRVSNYSPGEVAFRHWTTENDPLVRDLFDIMYNMGQVDMMELLKDYLGTSKSERKKAENRIAEIKRQFCPELTDENGDIREHLEYFSGDRVPPDLESTSETVDEQNFIDVEEHEVQKTFSEQPIPNENPNQAAFNKILNVLDNATVKLSLNHDSLSKKGNPICGRFSNVYKNIPHFGNICVMKVFPMEEDDQCKLESQLSHALCEVKAVCRYQHPNIIPLIGYTFMQNELITKKSLCLVYPQVGETLFHYLYEPNFPPLNAMQRIQVLHAVAKALSYLHNCCNVTHRDVTSHNILLDENCQPYLIDFGLCMTNGQQLDSLYCDGTGGFLPPEFPTEKLVSPTQDMYAMGVLCILCSARKGITPFMKYSTETAGTYQTVQTANWLHTVMETQAANDVKKKYELGFEAAVMQIGLCEYVVPEYHFVLKEMLLGGLMCTDADVDKRMKSEVLANWLGQLRQRLITQLQSSQQQQFVSKSTDA